MQLNQVSRLNREIRRTVARWAQWYMPEATYSQEGEDVTLEGLGELLPLRKTVAKA